MASFLSKLGFEQTDANGNSRNLFAQLLDPVGVCLSPIVWEDTVITKPDITAEQDENTPNTPSQDTPPQVNTMNENVPEISSDE